MQRLLVSVGISSRRWLSSDLNRKTVVCNNGVIATWHPEIPFPYEHTRPVDLKKAKPAEEGSVLSKAVVSRKPPAPTNNDLKEIFYTDKNEWFTRTREDRLRSVSAPSPKKD